VSPARRGDGRASAGGRGSAGSDHARLATRAEVMKLARLLGHPAEEFHYLEHLAAADLRALRELATERLFDPAGTPLGRLAAASRLLPTAPIAAIAEHAFGPVLVGRIAGLIDPERAADVAARLPTGFLAEVAVHLDPRRAADVLARMPAQRIADVARELVARGEDVTLGRFVGHLPDEHLALSLRVMDDLTVVRVAFVLEDPGSLDRVLGLIAPGRLETLLDAAAGTDVWPDALELFATAREPLRSRVLGARAAGAASK